MGEVSWSAQGKLRGHWNLFFKRKSPSTTSEIFLTCNPNIIEVWRPEWETPTTALTAKANRKQLSNYGFKTACSSVLLLFHWHPHRHWPTYLENPKWILKLGKEEKPKNSVGQRWLPAPRFSTTLTCFVFLVAFLSDLGGGVVFCFSLSCSFLSSTFQRTKKKVPLSILIYSYFINHWEKLYN